VLSAAVACGELGPDFDRVVAVEVSTPDSLEQLDTLRPRARALNGRGDSVAATILWATLDTALLAVVNETTGKLVGKRPGADARIQARVGNLRSNLILVDVLAAADTLVATDTTADTVTVSAPDSLSDSLPVRVADTTGGVVGLGGRPVVWAITAPTGSGAVTLVTNDTARALVTVDTVATNGSGIAAIRVRLIADPRPDSAIVEARAQRAVGTTIPGSPVTFVVRFLP
jgi:hypothetical protein